MPYHDEGIYNVLDFNGGYWYSANNTVIVGGVDPVQNYTTLSQAIAAAQTTSGPGHTPQGGINPPSPHRSPSP
jgi:hypothetical protein